MPLRKFFSKKNPTIVERSSAAINDSEPVLSAHHPSIIAPTDDSEPHLTENHLAQPSERGHDITDYRALAVSKLQMEHPTVADTLMKIAKLHS